MGHSSADCGLISSTGSTIGSGVGALIGSGVATLTGSGVGTFTGSGGGGVSSTGGGGDGVGDLTLQPDFLNKLINQPGSSSITKDEKSRSPGFGRGSLLAGACHCTLAVRIRAALAH